MMNITLQKIKGNYQGKECFVLARCGILGAGDRLLMTAQKLDVSGTDVFSPLYVSISTDGGKSWGSFHRDHAFQDCFSSNGTRCVFGDVTHVFHQKTGVPLAVGRFFFYPRCQKSPQGDSTNYLCYAVFNEDRECFDDVKRLDVAGDYPFGITTWGSQIVENEQGELLIPVAIRRENGHYTSAVMRCSFDGRNLSFVGISNELDIPAKRGVFEASLIAFHGKYYLTLRHDDAGYVSVSDDGISFSEPAIWRWDNGDALPTYNTQQHWLICGDKLYLIYTRRGVNNDHVFRHRAPLLMAEVNTENMCVVRSTEMVIVPERGARLGNFGVTPMPDGSSLVVAAEWMQPIGCEKFGSDNTIFIAKIAP